MYQKKDKDKPTAELLMHSGLRSELVEQESKFCDLVIVASPPNGVITSTFENTITKSENPQLYSQELWNYERF